MYVRMLHISNPGREEPPLADGLDSKRAGPGLSPGHVEHVTIVDIRLEVDVEGMQSLQRWLQEMTKPIVDDPQSTALARRPDQECR